MSIDGKATINIGDFSRSGRTRGDNRASEHDFGTGEKYTPCGIVDEESGQMHLIFGSSYKTSDFLVDTLFEWWNDLPPDQQQQTHSRFQMNGTLLRPESCLATRLSPVKV